MLRYTHICLLAFILWATAFPVPAHAASLHHPQDTTPPPAGKYAFSIKELPNQDLLPVANIHRVWQDSEGYMWYATEGGGLCRDDGYRIEVFRSDRNTPSLLASNVLTCLTEDKHGRIWFGTRNGTYVLDKRGYTIRRLEGNELHDAWTGCMFTASDSSIWIGTGTKIYRYSSDGQSFEAFTSEWQGKAVGVTNFAETAATGLMAIQSHGGLIRFDKTKRAFTPMEWDNSLHPNFAVPDTRHGGAWVATWGQGIVKYKYSKKHGVCTILRQPCTVGIDGEGSFRSQVLNILYDRRRNILWAAAMDDLYAYEVRGDSLIAIDTQSFIPKGKKILDNIIMDFDGNIWVPGFSPHTFIVYQQENRMHRDEVSSMSDEVGYRIMVDMIVREDLRYYWIWQGRTQLTLYDSFTGDIAFANCSASPSPLHVDKCMAKCSTGKGIWAGSGSRIYRVWNEGGRIAWEEETRAEGGGQVITLHDKDGQSLYIGTDNALRLYDRHSHKLSTLADNVGIVKDIACDKDGTVYFIADRVGLCKIDGRQKMHRLTTQGTAIGAASFTSLAIAPDGCVWTATSEGNVFFLPKGELNLIDDERAGNHNGDEIKDIVADKCGNVWILSDKYLREYAPSTGVMRVMNSSDADIDMDYFHAVTLEGDSICLGGIGAFCMIAAAEQQGNSAQTSPIAVTGVRTNGNIRPVDLGSETIELQGEVDEVELFVSAFDYLHADSLQYAYRLSTDSDWTMLPKGVNSIMLHGLPYGRCDVEVSVTDRSRCRTCQTTNIVIIRRRPWYALLPVYIPFVVLAGILTLVWRKRRRRKRADADMQEASPAETVVANGDCPIGTDDEKPTQDSGAKKGHGEKPRQTMSRQDEEFILHATATVERNIDNAEYSVEQFSSDLCMSRMNLYRKLQNLTGQKPSEFIRSIRLKKATEILLAEDCSVAELVDRIGFGTARYFSKCFKERYGVAPSQYRQEMVGKENNTPIESV